MIRQPHGYLFGEFEIAPDAAELRRAGEVVHLEPRVLRLLVYLIEHRERLVPKQELLDAVWDEQFVTENALTKAIGRLRKALDDDAHDPTYIHTHHTLGYRFIAEVEEHGGGGEAAASTVGGVGDVRGRIRRPRLALIAAAATLVVVVGLIGLDRRADRERLERGSDLPEIRSLAVLPLANLSNEPEQEYFVEGVQEALITDLARITSLRVVSRQSAIRFRDSELTAPEIAEQLGVDALVEGSVMREGDRVGIWAQLLHGPSDRHVWAQSYEHDVESVLVLTNQVARTISDELEVALTREADRLLTVPRRVDPETHDVYVRARHYLNQFTARGAIKAQELFRRTIALDPTFAQAHSGLAYAHLISVPRGTPAREAVPPAMAAALRAIELDDGIAEAHTVLGWVRLGNWDWSGARAELERALELNPCEPAARHAYADYLTAMGRPEEGLEHAMIGRDCDPLSPLAHVPVLGHLSMMGRHDEVIAESRKAIELFPDWARARYHLGWALFHEGRYEEAFHEFRAAPDTDSEINQARDRGFAEDGPRGAQRAVAELLAKRAETENISPLRIAEHFASVGEHDEAMRWLERAFDKRAGRLALIRVNANFDNLRSDPRFQEIIRQIGFPE